LADEAVVSCYRGAFNVDEEQPRNRAQFEQCLNKGRQVLFEEASRLESLLSQGLQNRYEVIKTLSDLRRAGLDYACDDIEAQLQMLFKEGFLLCTPRMWLQQYPRYLQAIRKRLELAPHLGPRDQAQSEELQGFWQRYLDLCDQGHISSREEIDLFRWMIEEYRVSLFAQSLGTHIPVSAKRLNKHWEQLRSQ